MFAFLDNVDLQPLLSFYITVILEYSLMLIHLFSIYCLVLSEVHNFTFSFVEWVCKLSTT